LTHSFGLWIFYQLLGQTLHGEAIRLVGTIAFTLVASVLLFHFVEDPMIQLGKRLTTGWAISHGPRDAAVQWETR
jgi:peptidoglycan/LPS O-acetylase OafA/YrhL